MARKGKVFRISRMHAGVRQYESYHFIPLGDHAVCVNPQQGEAGGQNYDSWEKAINELSGRHPENDGWTWQISDPPIE
ncbi:hypothetical protein GobsT_18320 [Gemmata obscuriglobus]|nr:hypothetical protein GobsT_18320 [Gemmata obscuriglobus]VTS03532.1 unnamed protein product [Gemmata obscuriglobus UQM 2246]